MKAAHVETEANGLQNMRIFTFFQIGCLSQQPLTELAIPPPTSVAVENGCDDSGSLPFPNLVVSQKYVGETVTTSGIPSKKRCFQNIKDILTIPQVGRKSECQGKR
jgi:hypothetical protein